MRTLQNLFLDRDGQDDVKVLFGEERKKKVDAHLEHTWNLLYVSANAAVDAASAQLGVSKSELFGKDAENAAATWSGWAFAAGYCRYVLQKEDAMELEVALR